MSPLRAILMRRPSRGLFKAYLNAEFNGYRKFITQILPPQVMCYAHSFSLCFSSQSPLPALSSQVRVVDAEKAYPKIPTEDIKKSYPDKTIIINDIDDIFLSAAPPQKLSRVIARGSSSMLSSKTKVSENEYKDQAKMLLDRVRQRFLERPNDDSVYVPGLSFNRKMMELLYEGKPFHMRLTQEYNGSVRMKFGMIVDIMVNYDSVEEAMEQCGESLYWALSSRFHRDEVFADSNGVYNADLHHYIHCKASDKEIYEAWVTILKFSTNQIIVNVSGMSIVDKNNVSWSD
ncbi:hypothetical protein KP509_1Z081300 [Ceratopteris richardii]|nr:hypothetical protein KP509_1Z081300 [Ceratopteris richardii]